VKRLLAALALAACRPSAAPNPYVPVPAPACAVEPEWIRINSCPNMVTPELADCVFCHGASGCFAADGQYCVVVEQGCWDGYCSRSLIPLEERRRRRASPPPRHRLKEEMGPRRLP
jgi:cytochrome c553